jgi:hypothetical protein
MDTTQSFNVPHTIDNQLIIMLKLIQVMRQAGAPLNLVDKVAHVFTEEAQSGRLNIAGLCSHRTALRRLAKLYPSLPMPTIKTISHERTAQELKDGTERPVLSFPTFSFLGQLQDLLDDHIFSDMKNLIVDPNDRWRHYKPYSCPHATSEIQDGNWFQSIVNHVENNSLPSDSAEFIIGIQGYVDKTGTDAYNRISVEPLVFTLTLLANKVRNLSKYWRVLALLPSSLCQTRTKKHTFGASVRNYHIALKEALDEFTTLQKQPPLVRLRIGNEVRMVKARLYWVNTIADGLANELLVGRIQNRTTSPRLSRACHCPQHLADNSRYQCRYIRQQSIERLVMAGLGPHPDNPGWKTYLHSLNKQELVNAAERLLVNRKKTSQAILKNVFGQHLVDLVWFQIDQGPNPGGCFSSTPIDPMHAFEEGIVPYILSVIIDPLSDIARSNIDSIAWNIVSGNRWNADYPRMNFSGGFSSLTQLTADEKMGKLLLLYVILNTPLGEDIFEKRCHHSFDDQRRSVASRFTYPETNDDSDNEEENNETLDRQSSDCTNVYTGLPQQQSRADRILVDLQLSFILPWIEQMGVHHAHILRKTVYELNTKKGKIVPNDNLPNTSCLDRRQVTGDVSLIYCDDLSGDNARADDPPVDYASYSLDCSIDQLKLLLEMLLSFHAAYKYGTNVHTDPSFEHNVRLLMRYITRWIKRGPETKNWSISKFHELLHMVYSMENFGSMSNVDAGKGEHGLKTWAKLPAKTVRPRNADQFFHDMATRIYENRLLELASDTILPIKRTQIEEQTVDRQETTTGDEDTSERIVRIELSQQLCSLERTGDSTIIPQLSCAIREVPNVVFPLTIYQEAHFFTPQKRIIRSCPNYRSSGPWRDWVHVQYENNRGERVFYPFQIHALFYLGKEPHAIGKMGLRTKKNSSKLMDVWVFESRMRVVDLQTVHTTPFVLVIPENCCIDNGRSIPDRFFVFTDRIDDWPVRFVQEWSSNEKNNRGKKRKSTSSIIV